MTDDALDYPATHRNREPIRDVLARCLPEQGRALEIASGSGQHVAFLAEQFPGLRWQPTDPDARCLASIRAWTSSLDNVDEPIALDASADRWTVDMFDAILCINMIHIAPWSACVGLMRGAATHLSPGGLLYMYGPYMRGGEHTAPSNARFSDDLRSRDPRWGVRNLEDVAELADAGGLHLVEVVPMPANNLSVLYRKRVEISTTDA